MNDIVVIIILILLNGVFSMSEIALISARRERLHSEALKGSRSASNALRLADIRIASCLQYKSASR